MDEECNLEALSAFLEYDSSEDERIDNEDNPRTSQQNKDSSASGEFNVSTARNVSEQNTPSISSNGQLSNTKDRSNSSNLPMQTNPQGDLLSELQKMRERMKELEDKLQGKNSMPIPQVSPQQIKPKVICNQKQTQMVSSNVDIFSSEGQSIQENSTKPSISPSASQNPPTKTAEISNKPSLKSELFGDSDNSDWEDLDGEKHKLSEEGDRMKKLLKKNEKRIAHTSTHDVSDLRAKALQKKSPVQSMITLESPYRSQSNGHIGSISNFSPSSNKTNIDAHTDPFSGIRIVKPLVSSTAMKSRMQDRKIIKVSQIHRKSQTELTQCDWVTIGVLIHKGEPRKSSSGKTYSIWKLNDLQDCDQNVSFFLFGEVYKTHWKVAVGTVIGILNPNMMDKSEKQQSDIAFTINHPHKLMVMGDSADLGNCQQRKFNGSPCTNVVNKTLGGFCTYHVTSAYKKSCVKRSELNSYTGVTPKCFNKRALPKAGMFFYQGNSFTSLPLGQQKNKVTLNKLQQQQTKLGTSTLSTMSLHQISATDKAKLDKLASEKEQAFLDILSTPSVGSMNLVKHLIKKEKFEDQSQRKVIVQSITPLELLKKHKHELEMKKRIRKMSAPMLGRGLQSGANINLGFAGSQSRQVPNFSSETAKKVAIRKIQSEGGLVQTNPNSTKKQLNDERQQKIKKRVAENMQPTSAEVEEQQSASALPPPAKRSKLLGNVDLNSSEVKKLMKMKSSHAGAITEMENEKKEIYFNALEKKEQCEEKMRSITEIKCTLYTCKVCSYTALSVGDRCKRDHHPTKKHQGMKRFFRCRKCKTRRVAFTIMPKDPCNECGEYNFEKTTMMVEKSGPKLESELLSIRGDEAKNLNSLSYTITSAIDL